MKRVILFLISSLCLSPLLLSAAEAPQAKPEAKPEAAKPPAPKPPVQQKKTKAPVPREIVGRAMTEARDAFRKNSDSDAALRILDSAMEAVHGRMPLGIQLRSARMISASKCPMGTR